MAKKKKEPIKKVIRQFQSGGITSKELKTIQKRTGATNQQIIKRIDSMNQNNRNVALNSGAANLIIRQAQKTPTYTQPSFGSGKIGKTIQSMIGRTAVPPQRWKNGGTMGSGVSGISPTKMFGGMQIGPRGNIRVRQPYGTVSTDIGAATAPPIENQVVKTDTTDAEEVDFDSFASSFENYMNQLLDSIQMPDMLDFQSMFDGFENLSSDYKAPDPLQLAALGRTTAGDAIRARQRNRKTRAQYRRGLSSPLGAALPSLAAMSIGGGVTL